MTDDKDEPERAEAGPDLGAAEGDAPDAAAPESNDALFEALWSRVLESWDDDRPHGALLEHALRSDRLPDLAGRYRKVKETDETRAERAQKKIDGIVIAATQMLMSMKTPARTKTPWTWTASVAFVCLFVLGWLAYKLLGMH